jgi:hypothetical protein
MMSKFSVGSKLVRSALRAQPGAGALSRTNFAGSSALLHTKVYGVKPMDGTDYLTDQKMVGDHSGRQQNHIWSKDEIDEQLKTLYRHQPVTFGDKIVQNVVSTLHLHIL